MIDISIITPFSLKNGILDGNCTIGTKSFLMILPKIFDSFILTFKKNNKCE
jgi:hypothetical protein